MLTNEMQTRPSPTIDRAPKPAAGGVAGKLGRGALVAATLAALSLTAAPNAAYARNSNVGAAIGLGILGGVLAGAAIASTVPPAYGAPPPAYYYPPQGYYPPAPAYYGPAEQYYGPTPYTYPQYYNQ